MLNDKQKEIIECIENQVKLHFTNDYSGHDYLHTKRVLQNALTLAESEGADVFTVMLAALLHDVDDIKLVADNYGEFYYCKKFLKTADVEEKVIIAVCEAVSSVSFSSSKSCSSIEAMIVQDADRLDALGAVGIARCFSYGGNKNRPIYTEEDFIGNNMQMSDSSISHFYQKLVKLEELMNTSAAKEEARIRTAYIKAYLKEFYRETNIEYVI